MSQTRVSYNEALYDRFGKTLNNITLRKKGNEHDQVVNYYFDHYDRLVKLGRINQGQEQLAYNYYDYAGNQTEAVNFAEERSE